MALDDAGVQLIAAGVAAYVSDINKADSTTTGFYKTLGSSDKSASSFQQVITGALRQVGAALVDFAVQGAKAIGGFVKDSIGLAGDFESGMLSFQAVAGKDVDTKGLEQFRDLFLDIGKRLPVSTSEVQQAAIEMVKGGIDPAIIAAGGLERNIQFAAAAMDGDLVKAAEISSKILGGWADVNASAADKTAFLAHSQDILSKAANASATDVEGLSRGIFQSQGIAKTAGVQFDDLVTTLAELAPRFASSAEAGTSLKNLIARLQPTTKPAIAAMEGLGLITADGTNKFYDASGAFIGFQQASELLKGSLQGLNEQQQAQVLQTIFGNDAMSAAAALAELGSAGYQHMADSLSAANGVTDTAALKQQGFNTALDNAKGSVETLQIQIGTFLLPILTDLLNNYIAPGVNAITSFAEAFMKMAPAIAASDDPLQTFLNALKVAAPGLMDFIVAIEDFKDAITPAVQEVIRLVDAFQQGGLGGLIDTIASDIEAALPDIEAALLSWGQAFLDWIGPMIPPLLQKLSDLASAAWDWIKQQAPEWGKQLQVWGEEFVAWIAPMIPPALSELGKLGQSFLTWIGDQATPLLKSLQAWATSFVAWIPGATVDFLKEWPKMFDEFLDWIGEQAGPLLKQLGNWALSFIEWIAPMIPPFLVALAGIVLAMATWIGETALVLVGKIKDKWLPAIIGWVVTDAVPGLYKALESIWKVFQNWILDIEKSLAQKMRDVGKSIVDGIQAGISSAWGSFTSWVHEQIMKIPAAVRAALGISSPSKVMADLVGAPIVQGIMQGMQSTVPALLQGVTSIKDQITGGFQGTDIVDMLTSLGEDVMAGFGAGLRAGWRGVKSIIDSTANSVEDAFQGALDAHSPSQRMVPIGQWVIQGIIQGMQDQLPVLSAFVGSFGDDLTRQMQDIADQVQGVIADAFGATASIDRQVASNLDKMKDVLPQYQQYTKGALDAAQAEAQQFADPAQGAKYFALRSKQILEYAKLQKDLADATSQEDKDRISQQMLLINQAQQAELSQFRANQQGQTTPQQAIGSQINAIIAALSHFNLTDDQIHMVDALAGLLSQITQPQSNPYANPTTTMPNVTNNTQNVNMPVYTNQSPTVLRDSMAIMGASLP